MHFFSARRQKRGFTLIEFMMVLALGGIVAAYQIQAQIQEIREVNVVHMANHINHFQRQSLQYYRDNSSWPINAAKLVSTGYINSNKDYYGDTYAVANNVAKNEFTVTMNTRELYYPSMLARLLPSVTISGTSISSTILPPGEEISHDALFSLDGSKALTGNMNANGKNIESVNEVGAEYVYSPSNPAYGMRPAGLSVLKNLNVDTLKIAGNLVEGAACTAKSIGTSNTGKFLTCKNAVWTPPISVNELPINSIYISVTSANPSTTLGYGTWVSFGAGRVLVGQDTSDVSFDRLSETGGSKTDSHALTISEMPSHDHNVYMSETSVRSKLFFNTSTLKVSNSGTKKTGSKGNGQRHEHDIVQPYITVKMWRRTR